MEQNELVRMTYAEIARHFGPLPLVRADIKESASTLKGVQIAVEQLGKDGKLFEMADLLKWVEETRRGE